MKTLLLSLLFILSIFNQLDALDIYPLMMCSVYKIEGKGKGKEPNIGTCFFIRKKTGFNKYQPVLITATHVLRGMTKNTITILLRYKNGNKFYVAPSEIQIRQNKQPLWREFKDVAAMKIELPTKADVKMLTVDFLSTSREIKKFSINTGIPVCVVGFPYGIGSGAGQFPMMRSGILSSFPINSQDDFLVDFEIFQGYSGSPVITNHKGAALILGMITDEVFLEEIRPGKKRNKIRGLGIGKAIPASSIKKLIDAI